MHKQLLKAGLLSPLISLMAVSALAQESTSPRQPKQNEAQLRKISLSIDGCYGSCPSYSVELDDQGTVVFTGHAYTQLKGQQKKQIPPQAFVQIQQLATKIRLRKLDRNYGPNSAHCPIWRTDASGGGIEAQYAGEEPINYSWYNGCTSMSTDLKPLHQLATAIMQVANVQDWIRVTNTDPFKELESQP